MYAYRFYPFFLECSMKETDTYKKRHLELLAFGEGGLITIAGAECTTLVASPKGDTQDSVYVTGNGNFQIPKIYSDEERDRLYNLVWNGETEFSRIEKEIKEHLSTWENLKKRDKLRMIDKYVLNLDCNFIEKKNAKDVITSALLLHLLKSDEIVYKNYEIKAISRDCVSMNFN